ncbi:hypothetical protein [Amycolatopsis sp. NPDC098790]|uniref:hypothetical protein n=1 Tax=Amycolatopsis sp. NPDC098790 TaxID=3363939 RepID=UPI0037FB8A2A
MKVWWSAAAAAAAAVLVAGCGGTSAPGNPAATPGESAPVTSGTSAEPSGQPESDPPRSSDPPGAVGSPIEYDSTQVGSRDRPAEKVRASIEGRLDDDTRGLGCPRPRCGITVRIVGSETACAVLLTPPKEVRRGGVITIHTDACPPSDEPVPPAESTSDSPSGTP